MHFTSLHVVGASVSVSLVELRFSFNAMATGRMQTMRKILVQLGSQLAMQVRKDSQDMHTYFTKNSKAVVLAAATFRIGNCQSMCI